MKKRIIYKKINYKDSYEKKEIKRLYKEIFRMNILEGEYLWGKANKYGEPLGVLAIDEESGRAVGHFTTSMAPAYINKKPVNFRISMGFMTDKEYRGNGIALNLYRKLKEEILLEDKAAFIVGFPNDISVKMHIEKMEYSLCREFHFVKIPFQKCTSDFQRIRLGKIKNVNVDNVNCNMIIHNKDYLLWRFADPKYIKCISSDNKLFIYTKFKNKIDLLYWDQEITEREFLEFAGFLYENEQVDSVETWNSMDFLDKYSKRERPYHMCINYLSLDNNMKSKIDKRWLFYMGDCELF